MLKEWKKLSTNCKLATFTLLFMSTQFIVFEGRILSYPKILFMILCPILALWRGIVFSKAMMLGVLFMGVTVLIQLTFHSDSFRYSTHVYALLFIFVFHLYYSLIWLKKSFTLEYFIKLIEFVFKAYFVFLIIQQVGFLIGFQPRFLNCVPELRGRFSLLNIEPSTSARILAVYFFAYLKCHEFLMGKQVNISYLWNNHKRIVLMFLYMMLSMASGTAIVALSIVSLYFLRPKYSLFVVPCILGIYSLAPMIEIEAVQRVYVTLNAAMTMDTSEVAKADHSASTRVNIILDTILHTDLSNSQTWIGYGDEDSGHAVAQAIQEYGMISYLFKLIFFVVCCFSSLIGIELLFFIFLLSFNVGNVVYGWAILMVFSTVKFFKKRYQGGRV